MTPKGGSDHAALGGDLAYRYGVGRLGDVGVGTALGVVGDPLFGTTAQALRSTAEIAQAPVRLGA